MRAPDTGDEIVDAVLAVAHQIRRAVNETLVAHAGLTLPRLKVLQLVATAGPLRPRDVADYVHVAPRTVTETVDGLEADGLVARTVHPTDRRAVLLVLTDAGRTRLAEAQRRRADVVSSFTRTLDADDRARLLDLLHAVFGAVASAAPAAPAAPPPTTPSPTTEHPSSDTAIHPK